MKRGVIKTPKEIPGNIVNVNRVQWCVICSPLARNEVVLYERGLQRDLDLIKHTRMTIHSWVIHRYFTGICVDCAEKYYFDFCLFV